MTDTNRPRTIEEWPEIPMDDGSQVESIFNACCFKEECCQRKRDLAAANAELAAVRELMNVYNLGGWTDAIGPMQRALAAEAKLSAASEHAKRIIEELARVRGELAIKDAVLQMPDNVQLIAIIAANTRAERAEAELAEWKSSGDRMAQRFNEVVAERDAAKTALDAHLARIRELESVLRPIIEWHDKPVGSDERFSECAKELDKLIDRAREVMKP